MARPIPDLDPMTAAEVATDDNIIIDDTSAQETKRIPVGDLLGLPNVGWTAAGEVWSFVSWNSTTRIGVVQVPTDATTKYAVDNYVKITQATGGTKYAKILSLTSTQLTLWFPSGVTLNNEAITIPQYSPLASPVGVPVTLTKGNPYRWKASKSTGAGNAPVAGAVVIYAQEDYDPLSGYDPTTSRYVAQVKGDHYVTASVQILEPNAAIVDCNIQIRKNGVLVKKGGNIKGASYPQPYVQGMISCNVGDYIDIFVVNVAGTLALETNVASGIFEGYLESRT